MTKYRIFKKYMNGSAEYVLFPVNVSNKESFRNFSIQKRNDGFNLTILTSKLMNLILRKIVSNGGYINSIEISDPVENEELTIDLNKTVRKINEKPVEIDSILKKHDWLFNDDSIFIEKMTLSIKNTKNYQQFEIYVNGMMVGDNVENIFNDVIKEAIDGFG